MALRCVFAMLLSAWALSASAASLTRVSAGTLPALPGSGELRGLVVADDTPLALRDGSLWQLDAKRSQWLPARWKAGAAAAPVLGLFGSGDAAYALTGTAPDVINGVARLRANGGTLVIDTLRSLPAPLRDVH